MNGSELATIFNLYIDKLRREFNTQRATEQSYRPALKALVESLDPTIIAVNESKRLAVGAPDLVIEHQERHMLRQAKLFSSPPLALVEAKDLHIDLDSKDNQEQLNRYLEMGNVLHTNHLEFRFYVNGKLLTTIHLAEKLEDGRIIPDSAQYNAFYVAFKGLLHSALTIKTPKMLADLMAQRARAIKEYIQTALVKDLSENNDTELRQQFEVFRNQLVHDLDEPKFADLYAQTLAYGLFAARYQDKTFKDFSLAEASEALPPTNPFLQKFFREISGYEKEERINWVLDSLVDVFQHCDVRRLMHGAGEEWTRQHDPIIHFYETFLDEYDPKLRRKMGVYYTPIPVVRYIVNAVDEVLKSEFDIPDGLASTDKVEVANKSNVRTKVDAKRGYSEGKKLVHRVQVLDPATGTGTFLNETIRLINKKVKPQLGTGWSKYVEQHLLPRIYGFEILMAPYAMAHLRLNLTLSESGFRPIANNERLKVYLANSLEKPHIEEDELPNLLGFQRILATEAQEADVVKTETPVMVVLGNPPYAGESSNKTDFAMNLVAPYKKEPGGKVRLDERNPKWINDDYVKFLAFAEKMINDTGEGVVAMITNHGYLDNPTFRGMRWHLLKSFSKIYVLDLHGNSKKKERAPDGGKDENVFNIQQGVSIILAIKKPKLNSDDVAEIFRADLWGAQAIKFAALDRNELSWESILPEPRLYGFVLNTKGDKETYKKGISVSDLFTSKSVGIVTGRDNLTIDSDKKRLLERLIDFASLDSNDAREKYQLGKDVRDWKVHLAQADINKNGPSSQKITRVSYRPFDSRFTYYTGHSRGILCYPRSEIMQHYMVGKNIGLMTSRQLKAGLEWRHVLVHHNIVESSFVSNKTSEIGYDFPLYLYPSEQAELNGEKRRANLNVDLIEQLLKSIGKYAWISDHKQKNESDQSKVSPLDILDYVYATLYSPSYRENYKEFLKTDFPRVPIPKDAVRFWQLVKLGSKLRVLHLMKAPGLKDTHFTPHGDGSWSVNKIRFEDTDNDVGNVWINNSQYFADVPKEAWDFYIGGYQPAQKWLKDRKGQELSSEDLLHYQKIIQVQSETIQLMQKIDQNL